MAHSITVDGETHAFLMGFAAARGESVSDTLKFLIDLNGSKTVRSAPPSNAQPARKRRRRPKTSLADLKRGGDLREGETVYLRDYRGSRVADYAATIAGERLSWNGRTYSMSALAELLLKEEGYSSDSVRGPAHWETATGSSIKELWDRRQPRSK